MGVRLSPITAFTPNTMTSHSQTRPVPSSCVLRPSEIVNVVYRSLQTALAELCSDRYEVPLNLTRTAEEAEDTASMRVQIERRAVARLPAKILVSHVGGNIYDVRCAVEAGPAEQYSYSLPGHANPSRAQAPQLGKNLAGFLLDELERRVGRQRLRHSAIPLPPKFSTTAPREQLETPSREPST